MRALTFWKNIIRDRSNMLEEFFHILDEAGIQYCLIGGQAVNAYVNPLVSLDLDLVVATHQIQPLVDLLKQDFIVKTFPHSVNVSRYGSDLRVQIQTDTRYASFLERATPRLVLGMQLPVACLEDVLQGKLWALEDPAGRGSKRMKDLADVARLIEAYPDLRKMIPPDIQHTIDK